VTHPLAPGLADAVALVAASSAPTTTLHRDGPHTDVAVSRRVVDVLVDDVRRLAVLSYLVPDHLDVATGDAVHLPYGDTECHGLVLGPSVTPTLATRDVISVFGQRVDPLDLALAEQIAAAHCCPFWQIASRLSPSSNRNAEPLRTGPALLVRPEPARNEPFLGDGPSRRMYLRSPLQDPARLAAREAVRILAAAQAADGDTPVAAPSLQILILAPTVELVERTLAEFASGAVRLDAKADSGAWPGFRNGTVAVGIGTRTAALYSAKHLAGIVVVEEDHIGHDESHLPYTNAARIAATRATAHGVPLSLISASPTPASLAGGVKLVSLTSPVDWPKVTVLDRTALAPGARLVPPVLAAKIRRAIAAGREVVALCDARPARRICTVCKTVRPCERCDLATCERHAPVTACRRCGDRRARVVGWDATRVTAALDVPALPLTELERLPAADRLVVLFDTDRLLDAPRLHPVTAFAQVTTRLASAAGGLGEIVVCTAQPGHPLLGMLSDRDQPAFTKLAWENARAAALPPFGHLVTIRVRRPSPPSTYGWPGRVAGPTRRGEEWEMLVRLSAAELPLIEEHIERLRRGGKLRFWVR
jgi:primosomal protein N'